MSASNPSDSANGKISEAEANTLRFGSFPVRAIITPLVLIGVAIAVLLQGPGDPTIQRCSFGRRRRITWELEPGDVCTTLGQRRTYEEMVAQEIATNWVFPAAAGIVLAVSVLALVTVIVRWRRDRRIQAGLNLGTVVLGASSSVRGSLMAAFGIIAFFGVAVMFSRDLIGYSFSWIALFPVGFFVLSLYSFVALFPPNGQLFAVSNEGAVTAVHWGRVKTTSWNKVVLQAASKERKVPTLQADGEVLLELRDGLVGGDKILALFTAQRPVR